MPTTLKLNKFDNYVTDDAAEINFGSRYDIVSKRDKFPDGPPTTVKVKNVLRNEGDGERTLNLDELSYVKTVKGGLRNPDAKHHRYTNENHDFHVYIVDRPLTPEQMERAKAVGLTPDANGMPTIMDGPDGDVQFSRNLEVVLVSGTGSYAKWMVLSYCDEGNSVLYAARNLPNCVAHDILDSLFHVYENGYAHGTRKTTREYQQAFVDGRLKKRKNRGESTYKVHIEDPTPVGSGVTFNFKIGGPSAFD